MVNQRNTYSRKSETKDTRKKILIVTEGKTEKEYFDEYNRKPELKVLTHDASDNKRSLVEKAINHRDELISQGDLEFDDRVWVVFDRDIDVSNKVDKDNFNQALQIASNSKINVAYSNDSFELWFLLHYQDVSSALHRKDINIKLSGHIGSSYTKGKGKDMYHLLKVRRSEALRRSTKMHKDMDKIHPVDANPSTTVHLLVDEIISSGFREKK
jgi:hypothetical protein